MHTLQKQKMYWFSASCHVRPAIRACGLTSAVLTIRGLSSKQGLSTSTRRSNGKAILYSLLTATKFLNSTEIIRIRTLETPGLWESRSAPSMIIRWQAVYGPRTNSLVELFFLDGTPDNSGTWIRTETVRSNLPTTAK